MAWKSKRSKARNEAFARGLEANLARAKRGESDPPAGKSTRGQAAGKSGRSANTGAQPTPALSGTWIEERATPAPCSSCGDAVQMRVRITANTGACDWGPPLCVPCARKARKGALPAECSPTPASEGPAGAHNTGAEDAR